jgi:hypothetical protein
VSVISTTPLDLRRFLGRQIGFDQGRRVYGSLCCAAINAGDALSPGRALARQVAFDQGRRVYAASGCSLFKPELGLARQVAFDQGRRVYAMTCCPQSGGGVSSSSSSAAAGPTYTCGACTAIPATLHATLSGTGCADGTYPLVYMGAATWTYGPTGVYCTNCQLLINVVCSGGVFQLYVVLVNGTSCFVTFNSVTFNQYQTPTGVTCNPLQVNYSWANGSNCHTFGPCGTAITVGTITVIVTK